MATSPPPNVSIIVPAYNVAQYIDETLASLALQSYSDFECIIVNDASTDATPQRAAAWEKADRRFRLIHHPHNKGLASTRNTGIQAAKGNLLAFLDSDDIWGPHMLEEMVKALEASPTEVVGVTVRNWKFDDESKKIFRASPPPFTESEAFGYEEVLRLMVRETAPSGWLVRRAVVPPTGELFTPGMRMVEDLEAMLRILSDDKRRRWLFINEPLWFYRVRSSSLFHGAQRNLIPLVEHTIYALGREVIRMEVKWPVKKEVACREIFRFALRTPSMGLRLRLWALLAIACPRFLVSEVRFRRKWKAEESRRWPLPDRGEAQVFFEEWLRSLADFRRRMEAGGVVS